MKTKIFLVGMMSRNLTVLMFLSLFIAVSCNKDTPRHHVKELIGKYDGNWTFTRNTGTTVEPGYLDVMPGSTKTSVTVGPEMAEFELNADLQPITLGTTHKLSFPNGDTRTIRFERYLIGQFASGTDVFLGTKR